MMLTFPKYDQLGQGYNKTRKADPYLTRRMLYHLAPKPEGLYLDIGCGTGNYTIEFQKNGYQFIGMDPSERMLSVAREKAPHMDWRKGEAEQTGLENKSVDGITGSLTIHHWTDIARAFQEMYRILKKGGQMVLFTSTPEQMHGYWLNHYFPKMLRDSWEQMPDLNKVVQGIVSAGFGRIKTEVYSIQKDLQDLFLYSGKHHPELYFKKSVRNGISSFAALANLDEVNKGLEILKRDLDSGFIKSVIQSYEHDKGDYLYILAKKDRD